MELIYAKNAKDLGKKGKDFVRVAPYSRLFCKKEEKANYLKMAKEVNDDLINNSRSCGNLD